MSNETNITFSLFYYGFLVTRNNNKIDFDEGSGELTASVTIGSYTITNLASAIASALNAAGTYTYACTFNRTTRILTITASSATDFLISTGSNSSSNILAELGFALSDSGSVTSLTGTSSAVSVFEPQFPLQGYRPTSDNFAAASATVNKSTSGEVQITSFGEEQFMKCEIQNQTNIYQNAWFIKNDPLGKENVNAFMKHCVQKNKVEFMYDEDDVDSFESFILDSVGRSKDGTAYELQEQYTKGLPGYYNIKGLVFRKLG